MRFESHGSELRTHVWAPNECLSRAHLGVHKPLKPVFVVYIRALLVGGIKTVLCTGWLAF